MKRVLVLLDQKENQQLLAEELAGRHEVLVGATDDAVEEDFDLCVVDGRSLDRLWAQVQHRKEREQPIFLPHRQCLEVHSTRRADPGGGRARRRARSGLGSG